MNQNCIKNSLIFYSPFNNFIKYFFLQKLSHRVHSIFQVHEYLIFMQELTAMAYPCCKYDEGKFKRRSPAQVILYRTISSSEINNNQQKCNNHLCKERHHPEPYKYALHNRANRRQGEWIERPDRRNYHYRPPSLDRKDISNFELQLPAGVHRFSPPTAIHHLHTHHHHYDFPHQQKQNNHHHYDFPLQQKQYNQKVGNNYDPHLMQLYLEVLESYRSKDEKLDPIDIRSGNQQGLYGGTTSIKSRTRLGYTQGRSPFRSSPPYHRFSEPDPLYHPNRSILFTYPTTSSLTTVSTTTPLFPDSINAQLPPLEHSTDTSIPYVSATMVTERTSLLKKFHSTTEMQPEYSEKPVTQDIVQKVNDHASTVLLEETTEVTTELSLLHDNSNIAEINKSNTSPEMPVNRIVENMTNEANIEFTNHSSEVTLPSDTHTSTEGNIIYTNSSKNELEMHTTNSTNADFMKNLEDSDSILITVGTNLMTGTEQNQPSFNKPESLFNNEQLNDTAINATMVIATSSINMPAGMNQMTQQNHVQTIFIAPQQVDTELLYSKTTIPTKNITEIMLNSSNDNEDKTEAKYHEVESESKMNKFIQSLMNHVRTHSIINETKIN